MAITEKMANRLRSTYEAERRREDENAFYRHKLTVVKRKLKTPFAYNSFFAGILMLYSIYITGQFTLGSNGLKENMGPLMGISVILIAGFLAFAGYLALCRLPFMSYVMIILYGLLFAGGATSLGGNILWFGGSKFKEYAPEAARQISFSYAVPLMIMSAIGAAVYIYGQLALYEYQYLESLEGFPHFTERVKKNKKYIPVGYIPVEMRKSDMDEIPPESYSENPESPLENRIKSDLYEIEGIPPMPEGEDA